MNLTPEQRKQINAEFRRQTAYHEAGHAAIHWMFSNLSDLEFIDMRGTAGAYAFVRARGMGAAEMAQGKRWQELHGWQRLFVQRSMMYHLAGYAAQGRIDEDLGGEWLDELYSGDREVDWGSSEEHDISRAIGVSNLLYGDNGNARRFLWRMASWADEALHHPRLWAVVEALAERLQTVKTRISGGRVVDIMAKAWPGANLPYLEMGDKWRRRFSFNTNAIALATKRTAGCVNE